MVNKIIQFFYLLKDYIEDIFYYDPLAFIQRGRRGYADRDLFNFDFYILPLLINMLKDYKDSANDIIVIDDITIQSYIDKLQLILIYKDEIFDDARMIDIKYEEIKKLINELKDSNFLDDLFSLWV